MEIKLLTIKEVCPMFNANEKTFRGWLADGKIPQKLYFTFGKSIRFKPKALQEFLEG